jgi:hypothetical protein
MNMYVPEIGDHIVLTEDWSFYLHNEYRNLDLGAFFGYHQSNQGWIDNSLVAPLVIPDYTVNYPDRKNFLKRADPFSIRYSYDDDAYNKACHQAELDCPAYVKYDFDMKMYIEACKRVGVETIPITLPAGTILAIDRIYIRKGSKDFSSITFFAKNLGEVIVTHRYSSKPKKKLAFRFWSKLHDCNKIMFEKIEK